MVGADSVGCAAAATADVYIVHECLHDRITSIIRECPTQPIISAIVSAAVPFLLTLRPPSPHQDFLVTTALPYMSFRMLFFQS